MTEKKPAESKILVDGEARPAAEQPAQSELQASFRASGARIVIDMVAALPIARDLVREARKAAFARNDVAITIAARRGEGLEALNAKAEALADAPADPRLAAATTPDELMAAVRAIVEEF